MWSSPKNAAPRKGATPRRSTEAWTKASRPPLRTAARWRAWQPFRSIAARWRVSPPLRSIAARTKAAQSFRASAPAQAPPFRTGGSEPSGRHRCCRLPAAEQAPSDPETRLRRDERVMPYASPRSRSFAGQFPFGAPSGARATRHRSEADSERYDRRQGPETQAPKAAHARSLWCPLALAREAQLCPAELRLRQAPYGGSSPATDPPQESSPRASGRLPSSGCRLSAQGSMCHWHPAG